MAEYQSRTETSPLIATTAGDNEALEMHYRSSSSSSKRYKIAIILLVISNIAFIVSFAYYFHWYLRSSANKVPDWKKPYISDSVQGKYKYHAVASDSVMCSNLGSYVLDILRGNAMDAGVATVMCVGVANFHSAGIGGGSFMMYYDRPNRKHYAYDYRETAPAAASKDMFNNLPRNASTRGGLAIGIPGEVAGLHLAHKQHGTIPWSLLVSQIVKILDNGQAITEPLAEAMAGVFERLPDEFPFVELKNWMINKNTKKLYEAGDLLRDHKLRDTFAEIAKDPFSFYNGTLSKRIINETADAGVIFTAEDLQKYAVSTPVPIVIGLESRNLTAAFLPPPSSGAVLAFILNLIDGYGMTADSVWSSLDSYVTFLHRIIESFKFAYAKRSALGDQDFVNVTELVRNLTSDKYANEIRNQITDTETHDVSYYGPSFDWHEDHGTTHVSIVDSSGNAFTVTSTVNTHFGCLIRGASTGIIYNNEMDDFSIPNRTNIFGVPPSVQNFIAPGKRPLSSMAPVVISDGTYGQIKFVSGAAGGTRITTSIAYTLLRMLILKETPKQANDVFRIHHQLVPNHIQWNDRHDRIPQDIMQGLKNKGHTFATSTSKSVIEVIASQDTVVKDAKGWFADTDYRKPSLPSGY